MFSPHLPNPLCACTMFAVSFTLALSSMLMRGLNFAFDLKVNTVVAAGPLEPSLQW